MMRTWTTLRDACWIEQATKQAPFFVQMGGRQEGSHELILSPKAARHFRDIDEDWEGTSVFWPPVGEGNAWTVHSEDWQDAKVVAVDLPEVDGTAPAIFVRLDHPVDRETARAFETCVNVGHREFDFYAPLTAWADDRAEAPPAAAPDPWLRVRTTEQQVVPAWSTDRLDPDKVTALDVQRRRLGVLWGPPGTGKTYAVGHLVARRMQAEPNLRVLVLSISNRAVDIAALAVDDAWAQVAPATHPPDEWTLVRARAPAHERMLEPARGHLLRGYHDTVAPFKARRTALFEELRGLANTRDNAAARLRLREELKANTDGMNTALKGLLMRARCVFATINHAVHSPSIEIGQFGLVIIDEAGFVQAAAFALVAASCNGAMVVAGDFQQLPPIVSFNPKPSFGNTRRRWPTPNFRGRTFPWLADEQARRDRHRDVYFWFGETVYDMLGIADRAIGCDDDALRARARASGDGWFAMLKDQRRMPESVCRFVAEQTYGGPGALRTVPGIEHRLFHAARDGVQHPLLWVNVEGHTAGGTASGLFNTTTAKAAVDLALAAARQGGNVRLLTRYNAQMKTIRNLLDGLRYHNGAEVMDRIATSTVHRAQGDEADLVIFDSIHTVPPHVDGDIAWRDELRLCNVIVSRTKGQFVAFLHPSYLPEHPYWQAYLREAREIQVPGLQARELPGPAGPRGAGAARPFGRRW